MADDTFDFYSLETPLGQTYTGQNGVEVDNTERTIGLTTEVRNKLESLTTNVVNLQNNKEDKLPTGANKTFLYKNESGEKSWKAIVEGGTYLEVNSIALDSKGYLVTFVGGSKFLLPFDAVGELKLNISSDSKKVEIVGAEKISLTLTDTETTGTLTDDQYNKLIEKDNNFIEITTDTNIITKYIYLGKNDENRYYININYVHDSAVIKIMSIKIADKTWTLITSSAASVEIDNKTIIKDSSTGILRTSIGGYYVSEENPIVKEGYVTVAETVAQNVFKLEQDAVVIQTTFNVGETLKYSYLDPYAHQVNGEQVAEELTIKPYGQDSQLFTCLYLGKVDSIIIYLACREGNLYLCSLEEDITAIVPDLMFNYVNSLGVQVETIHGQCVPIDGTTITLDSDGRLTVSDVNIDGKTIIKDTDNKLKTAVGGYDDREEVPVMQDFTVQGTEIGESIIADPDGNSVALSLGERYTVSAQVSGVGEIKVENIPAEDIIDYQNNNLVAIPLQTAPVGPFDLPILVGYSAIDNKNYICTLAGIEVTEEAWQQFIDNILNCSVFTSSGELSYIDNKFINVDGTTIIVNDEYKLSALPSNVNIDNKTIIKDVDNNIATSLGAYDSRQYEPAIIEYTKKDTVEGESLISDDYDSSYKIEIDDIFDAILTFNSFERLHNSEGLGIPTVSKQNNNLMGVYVGDMIVDEYVVPLYIGFSEDTNKNYVFTPSDTALGTDTWYTIINDLVACNLGKVTGELSRIDNKFISVDNNTIIVNGEGKLQASVGSVEIDNYTIAKDSDDKIATTIGGSYVESPSEIYNNTAILSQYNGNNNIYKIDNSVSGFNLNENIIGNISIEEEGIDHPFNGITSEMIFTGLGDGIIYNVAAIYMIDVLGFSLNLCTYNSDLFLMAEGDISSYATYNIKLIVNKIEPTFSTIKALCVPVDGDTIVVENDKIKVNDEIIQPKLEAANSINIGASNDISVAYTDAAGANKTAMKIVKCTQAEYAATTSKENTFFIIIG